MKTIVSITTFTGHDDKPSPVNLEIGEAAQKHVLRTFNPSGDPTVDMTKVLCAAVIQQMIDLEQSAADACARAGTDEAVAKSMATTRATCKAIDLAEALQMQAVKANFVQA